MAAPEQLFVYYHLLTCCLMRTIDGEHDNVTRIHHIPQSCHQHNCLCWSYTEINTLVQGQKDFKNKQNYEKQQLHIKRHFTWSIIAELQALAVQILVNFSFSIQTCESPQFQTTSYCPLISFIMTQAKMMPRICKNAIARAMAPISTNFALTKSSNFCLHPAVYRLFLTLTHWGFLWSLMQQLFGAPEAVLFPGAAVLPEGAAVGAVPFPVLFDGDGVVFDGAGVVFDDALKCQSFWPSIPQHLNWEDKNHKYSINL